MCAARLRCRAICRANTARFLSLTILASCNKIMVNFFCKYSNKIIVFQDLTVSYAGMLEPGVPGMPLATPIFGRSVNPVPTRLGRFCPLQYYWHPKLFHLPAFLNYEVPDSLDMVRQIAKYLPY